MWWRTGTHTGPAGGVGTGVGDSVTPVATRPQLAGALYSDIALHGCPPEASVPDAPTVALVGHVVADSAGQVLAVVLPLAVVLAVAPAALEPLAS